MNENKKGFTLAETLITLTILGVVAAITVPSLINKQTESANRTKIKKAMAVYEKALNQMIIDNDIKNDTGLAALNDATCSKTYEYFKIVEKLNNSTNCEFKTADRVYWNISDIQHPIISVDKEKRNDTSFDKTFILAGYYDNEVLRINDLGAAKGTNKINLKKVYEFVLNKTLEDGGNSCPNCILGSPYTSLDDFPECSSANGVLINCKLGSDEYYMDGYIVQTQCWGPSSREEYCVMARNNDSTMRRPDGHYYFLNDCEGFATNCNTCTLFDNNISDPCPTPDANGKYSATRTNDNP